MSVPPSNLTAQRIAAAVRARRLELGLRQSDLAEAIGMATSQISNIERAVPGHVRTLVEVCDALGLTLLALPRESSDAARITHALDSAIEGSRRRAPRRPSADA